MLHRILQLSLANPGKSWFFQIRQQINQQIRQQVCPATEEGNKGKRYESVLYSMSSPLIVVLYEIIHYANIRIAKTLLVVL